MANYVKVSTIAASLIKECLGTDNAAVRKVIDYWKGQIEQVLPDHPDLILLPECCDDLPFASQDERSVYYRNRGRKVADALAAIARENHCYIAYAHIRDMDDSSRRNSIEIIGRDGHTVGFYNKYFPVIGETDDMGVAPAADVKLIECDFGRVGGAICFDLNFDGIRTQYVDLRPDLVLFSSMYHGGLMQSYWAYSCRAHLATCVSNHPSGLLSPVGHTIAMTTNYFNHVTATINLDCEVVHLDGNWDKLRAMKAKYGAGVSVFDPGHLAAVLISSESDAFTVHDLVKEFEIERLDDYFARSIAHAEKTRAEH